MGTIARVAHGDASHLIERAADVVLKQKKNLIVCPRESPFNRIHLRNLLTLSELGASIVPLMPGFYHRSKSIEDLVQFMVGRILELIDFEHKLYRPWAEDRW